MSSILWRTDLEFSNPLRLGATYACTMKDWLGGKREREKKEMKCLLIVCLHSNSSNFPSKYSSFLPSPFMVQGSTLPTSRVITWFKPQPIATLGYCMRWLVQAGQSRSNQRKAQDYQRYQRTGSVSFCSGSLKGVEVSQAILLHLGGWD